MRSHWWLGLFAFALVSALTYLGPLTSPAIAECNPLVEFDCGDPPPPPLDTTPPVFTFFPSKLSLDPEMSCPPSAVGVTWLKPQATDDVDGNIVPVLVSPNSEVTCASIQPGGNPITVPVSYTATDAAGNQASRSSILTIALSQPDTVAPVFTSSPGVVMVSTAPGLLTQIVTWTTPTVNDAVDGAITPVQTAGLASDSEFPIGPTTITYTATDAAGNFSTLSFTVMVMPTPASDTTPPGFSNFPDNIALDTAPGETTQIATWTAPTANDVVDGPITPTQTAGGASGSAFPVGTTTVTYAAKDASGNVATQSFTVTVTAIAAPPDATPPVFTSTQQNMEIATAAGETSAVATWTAPTANDAADGAITPVQTAGSASGSTFPVGTTTITYTATDNAFNVATYSFTVTVTKTPASVSGIEFRFKIRNENRKLATYSGALKIHSPDGGGGASHIVIADKKELIIITAQSCPEIDLTSWLKTDGI